jgi:hypothetical protein
MSDEITELRRRVSLVERDVEGERTVSPHILRKVTESEALILDVRAEVADLRKELVSFARKSRRCAAISSHCVRTCLA